MNLVKIISSTIESGKRIVKFLKSGLKDVQTSHEAMPFGVDTNAPRDTIAVYSPTSQNGRTVIIGYINVNQLADVGESRYYSTNTSGTDVQMYLHLKNDGTAEFNGSDDFMVRFNALKLGFDQLKTEFNAHLHTGNLGAPTTPPTIPSTASIDNSKLDKIKTYGT